MITHDLNLNLLRVFESVHRTASMTEAAKELHLTQSGVSQHITALEDALKVKLFDRIKQRIISTDEGNRLYKQCSTTLNDLENVIWDLKGEERGLQGNVNIGMPIEFGNNVLMPLVAQFLRKNPRVTCKFNLGFASTMNDLLLKGELDFAIIDQFTMDRHITTKKVYDEIVELCISEELLKEKGAFRHTPKFYESLDYVEYQTGNPVLQMWFDHHLSKHRMDFNVKAYIMDVQGMARLILQGVGAGVLPSHLVSKLQSEGKAITILKGCGKPLKNSIGMASLNQRTLSRAAFAAYDCILQGLTTRGVPEPSFSISN